MPGLFARRHRRCVWSAALRGWGARMAGAGLPRIVFQQVGGLAVDHQEGKPADLENARMQITCWSAERDQSTALAKQVEDALLAAPAPVQATRLGARVSVVDDDTGLRGARQDYSMWLPR